MSVFRGNPHYLMLIPFAVFSFVQAYYYYRSGKRLSCVGLVLAGVSDASWVWASLRVLIPHLAPRS
jgi:hypothetical protein